MSRTWVDGRFVAVAPPDLPDLETGNGVFETILVDDGEPKFLGAHLDRLLRSAKDRSLPHLPGRDDLLAACTTLAEHAPNPGRMRVLLDVGTAAVTVDRFAGYPPEIYEEGVDVVLAGLAGHPLGDAAGHKLLPYAPLLDARQVARDRGAFEVLFVDHDGALLEGSASNLFVVEKGRLLTPPTTRPILPGVTRAAALVAAGALGIPFAEADVRPEHFAVADEAFLTGSLMEVVPIRGAAGARLAPGETAARLRRELFGR